MILSLIVCLVGLLMFALSNNGKLMDIGKFMFAMGLLAFLLIGGGSVDRYMRVPTSATQRLR